LNWKDKSDHRNVRYEDKFSYQWPCDFVEWSHTMISRSVSSTIFIWRQWLIRCLVAVLCKHRFYVSSKWLFDENVRVECDVFTSLGELVEILDDANVRAINCLYHNILRSTIINIFNVSWIIHKIMKYRRHETTNSLYNLLFSIRNRTVKVSSKSIQQFLSFEIVNIHCNCASIYKKIA